MKRCSGKSMPVDSLGVANQSNQENQENQANQAVVVVEAKPDQSNHVVAVMEEGVRISFTAEDTLRNQQEMQRLLQRNNPN